jgi:hypothetical protein
MKGGQLPLLPPGVILFYGQKKISDAIFNRIEHKGLHRTKEEPFFRAPTFINETFNWRSRILFLFLLTCSRKWWLPLSKELTISEVSARCTSSNFDGNKKRTFYPTNGSILTDDKEVQQAFWHEQHFLFWIIAICGWFSSIGQKT